MSYKFETFDWSQFDEFRGDAPLDLIEFFSAIADADSEKHDAALDEMPLWPIELVREIGRLGAVPQAIECLIELVAAPEINNRGRILGIVNHLACLADDYCWWTRWFAGEPTDLLIAVHDRFAEGRATYIDSLRQDDVALRCEAAHALRLLGRADAAPALLNCLSTESDATVVHSLLRALSVIRPPEAINRAEAFLNADHPLLRVGAAEVLAQIERPLPNRGLHMLTAMAFPRNQLAVERNRYSRPHSVPEFNADCDAVAVVRRLGGNAIDIALNDWLDDTESIAPELIHKHFLLLFSWIFPGNPKPAFAEPVPGEPDPDFSREQLSKRVRRVLEALVSCDLYWDTDNEVAFRGRERVLEDRYNLPVTREEIAQRIQHP